MQITILLFTYLETPALPSELTLKCDTNKSCTLSWKRPFSLDITGVEPDVVYIVELYKIFSSCDSEGNRQLMNGTHVQKESYEFTQPNFLYELLVIPRNNLEEAENGSNKTLGGE